VTTVLITGFGPFPRAPFNPSGPLARRLAERGRPALAGIRRIAHVFPTSYRAVDRDLPALIARHRPAVVLLFGLAARTPHLRIETRACNRRTPLFPDAQRFAPEAPAIRPGGPPAHGSRAPHHRLVAAARAAGVPARLSRDAGPYVCNFAYWRALEQATEEAQPLVQFVHIPLIARGPVPLARSRRRRPMLEDLTRAGEAILLALLAARAHSAKVDTGFASECALKLRVGALSGRPTGIHSA
jgi:pyroglutamyl-peptidase